MTDIGCKVQQKRKPICASVQTVDLSALNSTAVVKTKIKLNSHADTCIVGDHCLIVHDHNRTVNIYDTIPKQDQSMLT